MDWLETPFGFQPIVWTFVRHTVSSRAVNWDSRVQGPVSPGYASQYNWLPPVPTYGSTWVVLWLLFFRSAPSTFPQQTVHFLGSVSGTPYALDYSQKSTISTLALKPSV